MEDKNRNIKLINGEEDKTMRLDFSPYTVEVKGKVIPMGQNIWEAMLANTWFIDETNLTEDVYDWNYKMTDKNILDKLLDEVEKLDLNELLDISCKQDDELKKNVGIALYTYILGKRQEKVINNKDFIL